MVHILCRPRALSPIGRGAPLIADIMSTVAACAQAGTRFGASGRFLEFDPMWSLGAQIVAKRRLIAGFSAIIDPICL